MCVRTGLNFSIFKLFEGPIVTFQIFSIKVAKIYFGEGSRLQPNSPNFEVSRLASFWPKTFPSNFSPFEKKYTRYSPKEQVCRSDHFWSF